MWKYLKYSTVAVSMMAFGYLWATIGWVQAFGWVYSLAFALSALPEAIQCVKRGETGVADGTIILWMIGEIAGLAYGFGLWQLPIIFNCALNTLFVGIISYYRLWPRRKS